MSRLHKFLQLLNGIFEQNVIICHCINNSFSSVYEGIFLHDHIKKNRLYQCGLGFNMNMIKKIKTLLKEAELYHSQGLLYEAIAKYNDASELIQKNEQLKNKLNLLEGISKKVNVLKKDISKIELAPKKPEVSENIQDLIKKMYAFSPDVDEDAKALEGAVALAKFGQFKRAI